MTVANQTNRTSAVGTNTIGQEIAFSFPITATTDLVVKTRVTATGVEATLTETTNYTVAITGDTGGTVTMVTAVATTSEIHVIRDTPMTQSLDLEQGGTFNAENIENALDKNTKLNIESADTMSRALAVPDTDSSSLDMELPNSVDRADKYLTFDSNGEPTVTSSQEVDPGTVEISDYAETYLDDANEATFKATTNLEIGTDVQAHDAGLLSIAGLTTAANKMIYTTASDTYAVTALTAAARTVLDDATTAAMLTTLGAVATTGAETVAGVKTFSSFPVTPSSAPTTNYQTANKKYVDDNSSTSLIYQVVNTQTGAVNTGTTTIPYDDSIPQKTEGTEFMTLAITPNSATNKLKIDVVLNFGFPTLAAITAALFQDTTTNALAAANNNRHHSTGTSPKQVSFTHYMTTGTTSETTFKVRAGASAAGTFTFNGWGGARRYGGVMASSITITEVVV